MNEKEKIDYLNLLRNGIYLYNWIIEPSDLGLPWVRLKHYSCCSYKGEQLLCRDYDAQEMKAAFEANQNISNPEDFLTNIDKCVKYAGPVYYITSN